MADATQKAGDLIVYKPTGTIQISNKFTLLEQKLLNLLIWDAQRKDELIPEKAGTVSVIPIREALVLLGRGGSNNIDPLKEGLRTLTGTVIEWNATGQDKVVDWGVCTFLASGRITKGKLYYRINPEIVSKIRNPILYAKMQLLISSQMRRRYALVLYEQFIDALSRKKKSVTELVLELDVLYTLLGHSPNDSPMPYKYFSRDYLKPACEEICRVTDIEVTYESERPRRKVQNVRFNIVRKSSFQLAFDFENLALDDGDRFPSSQTVVTLRPKTVRDDVVPASSISEQPLRKALLDLNVQASIVDDLMTKYDWHRIQRNLNYTLASKARNRAAYLVRAVEKDYAAASPVNDGNEVNLKTKPQRRTTTANPTKNLDSKQTNAKIYFNSLSEAQQDQLREKFSARVLTGDLSEDAALRKALSQRGFNSPIVQGYFWAELAKTIDIRE